ncbi:helix-turn-helix domain-containing protein [Delftia deserti]|uniref:Helix-turn-helix domain-containing protein n=1 Tax=Delftia deserti TaxID=1651218 RepID=A0ABW5EPT5_9BURK
MLDFSARLKEERKRLGLNQESFGTVAGVSQMSQLNYEKGVRKPDAEYLMAIAAHGVDVSYLLTGLRSFDPSAALHPSPGQTIAARLQQERKRLGLTFGQLSEKSGVDRLALLKFEEGEFAPDAKALQQLHAVGVDVGYVLLSLRVGAAGSDTGAAASVSSESQQLLQHYDKAPQEAQAALRTLAALAARA